MAIYVFENPNTGETIELSFGMNDKKSYIDQNGVEWERVYFPTLFAFDTKIDPHDSKAFVKKTDKAGTIGDIMDLSKEMSERRGGKKNDPVKKEFSKDWKKRRKMN